MLSDNADKRYDDYVWQMRDVKIAELNKEMMFREDINFVGNNDDPVYLAMMINNGAVSTQWLSYLRKENWKLYLQIRDILIEED